LRAPELGYAWWQHGVTDSNGEFRFASLGMARVLLNATHSTLGMRSDVPIDLEGRDPSDAFVIVLAPTDRIRIRCMDGATPVSALQVRFFAEQCEFHVGSFVTGLDGRAESGPVAHGRFRVSLQQAGVWPVVAVVESRADASTVDVAVKQLGDIEMRFTRIGGAPVVGASVELRSEEFAKSLSEWIDEGRVAAPPHGLETDADGRWSATGLPHGRYSWNVHAPDGGTASGDLVIPPRGLGRHEATVAQ
jgi:hypothetical protein